MDGLLLQNFITIRGQNDTTKVTQGADAWIDLGDQEDVVLYLDVRELTGAANMSYETSTTKQEVSFMAMLPAFPLATGLRIDRALFGTAAVPPARYLRWRLIGASVPWDVTFRIWLATYSLA